MVCCDDESLELGAAEVVGGVDDVNGKKKRRERGGKGGTKAKIMPS